MIRNLLTIQRWIKIAGVLLIVSCIAQPAFTEESEDENRRSSRISGINVMQAFLSAYPHKFDRVTYRHGDWAIESKGVWFFWAEGKLLPESEMENAAMFSRHSFYPYTDNLPPISVLAPEEKAALRARIVERERSLIGRHPGLFNAIWRIEDKSSGWNRVKTTYFLGMKVMVHRELLEDLAAVEEELLLLMETDKEIERYVESIGLLDGFNWRAIAGTISLSLHSYGIAIDFVPNRTGGRETYWRWARDRTEEWYSLPYANRFMPPAAFVRAFEKRGFIWGGKWFYFDTIHFEYRPEILALNGYSKIVVEQEGSLPVEEFWVPSDGRSSWSQ